MLYTLVLLSTFFNGHVQRDVLRDHLTYFQCTDDKVMLEKSNLLKPQQKLVCETET